jgi:putative transcriptional regulator
MNKNRILKIRTQLKATQQQLAVELGVSVKTINRWESGESQPSPMATVLLRKLEEAIIEKENNQAVKSD